MSSKNIDPNNIPFSILKTSRWIILITLLAIFSILTFVKFPDVLVGETTLTTQSPPIALYPKQTGKIGTLYIQEGDTVKKGDFICILDNTTNYADLQYVEDLLPKVQSNLAGFSPKLNITLGNLQPFYSTLLENLRDYNYNLSNKNPVMQATILQAQINQLEEVIKVNLTLQDIMKQETNNIEKNYDRSKKLKNGGTISDLQFEKEELKNIQHKQKLETIKIEISNNKIRIEQLKMQLINIEAEVNLADYDKRNNTLRSIENLKAEIGKWKAANIIIAPAQGIISMNKIRGNNEYIDKSNPICTIIPFEIDNEIFALSSIHMRKSGKLAIGNQVNIKFYNFPFKEFGVISGKVRNIHLIADEEMYVFQVEIPYPLMTSYNMELPYQPEMKGKIEVILEKKNLLSKVADELYHLALN